MPADRLAVDAPHLAGMVQIHPINHPDRLGRDKIAADHPQPAALTGQRTQTRLDGDAQTAHRIHHAAQGIAVGNAQILMKPRTHAPHGQPLLDLRTRPMHQHQTHTQAVEQHDVVDDVVEIRVRNRLTRQQHDKGALAVGIDIGRGVAKPLDVVGHAAVPWKNASVETIRPDQQGQTPQVVPPA